MIAPIVVAFTRQGLVAATGGSAELSLCRVYTCVIEEYARHSGHADLRIFLEYVYQAG